MGTRGSYGFRYNGRDYTSYNHYDSYPSYLGASLAKQWDAVTEKMTLPQIRHVVSVMRMVDESAKPTDADIDRTAAYHDFGVGEQSADDWYCLLRGAQGRIDAALELGIMVDGEGFMADSLFCEWAYIFNLDSERLEVYVGFNQDPNAAGRYASQGGERPFPNAPIYHGVRLIREIPFEDLGEIDWDHFAGEETA